MGAPAARLLRQSAEARILISNDILGSFGFSRHDLADGVRVRVAAAPIASTPHGRTHLRHQYILSYY
jgi:hypothetical protein